MCNEFTLFLLKSNNRCGTRKKWIGGFDKVPHKRLLWKFRNRGGFGGTVINWMEDYLTRREMRTVGERESTYKIIRKNE